MTRKRIYILSALLLLGGTAYAQNAKSPVKLAKPTPDIQTLVSKGKHPAFFDPENLAKPPVLSAKSAILMDADTQQVLWEKNADELRAPASTTKILTGLLLAEHSQPTDVITCLDPTVRKIEESSLHIQPWEKFTAKDLLYGLMLRSANDGAVVVAESVAGSVPRFAELMNRRAAELGATNTHFTNPNGLFDPQHYTTARDLAKIAAGAMQNSRFADAVSLPRRKIARSKATQDVIVSSKARKFYKYLPGADGVKTGWVRQSGQCFVGSATRQNRRLLCVIMGANGNASGEAIPVLSWGFRRFPQTPLAKKNEGVGSVIVQNGDVANVPVVAGQNLHITTDSLSLMPALPADTVHSALVPVPNLTAPVRKGQEVGRLVAKWGDRTEVASVPVLAAQDVAVAPVSQLVQTTTQGFSHAWWWLLGMVSVLLVVWGYGTASAKSARRRRNRVKTFFGNVDNAGAGQGGRGNDNAIGDDGRPRSE